MVGEGRRHYNEMKRLLSEDVLKGRKNFSWRRILLRCLRDPQNKYVVWWRIANCLFLQGGKTKTKLARKINRRLISKYNTEIMLGASIDGGLRVYHFNGAVINSGVAIGKNFRIGQNTTIGEKRKIVRITIGDNVEIGANSCIIADNLTIGDNVIIGAMSFINKDVPSNCTVYTQKNNVIKTCM